MKNTTINKMKDELRTKYNVFASFSELQGGCIGIKHEAQDTIKVRYIAKLMGLQRMDKEQYKNVFFKTVSANTIVY